LKGLLGLLELVAVLSGRPAAEARRMVGLPGRAIPLRGSPGPGGLGKKGVVYIGHHGLSRWDQGREEMLPGAEPFAALAAQARRELSHLETMPGLLLEDKAFGLSIHYRQAPSAAAAGSSSRTTSRCRTSRRRRWSSSPSRPSRGTRPRTFP